MNSSGASTIIYVLGGIAVIVALARYMPKIAGWVLLATVLVMLYVARQKGLLTP